MTGAARWRAALGNPYLTLISRLVLGGIFFLAGLAKLGVPDALTASINSYGMPLPDWLVQALALSLPTLEIVAGLWLIVGLFTRLAAAASGGLLLVFLIALIQATLRGLSPDCGCFSGPAGNPMGLALLHALGPVGDFLINGEVGSTTILRDLVFLAMAVHLWRVPTVFALDNLLARRFAVADEEEAEAIDEPVPALSEPAEAVRR
jgi:uncharacterized membrane protein YphA (DoxX/SURF4 family)